MEKHLIFLVPVGCYTYIQFPFKESTTRFHTLRLIALLIRFSDNIEQFQYHSIQR